MLEWGIDLFWFEAFDEPNKADAIGDDGQVASEKYWGSFTSDRTPKFNMVSSTPRTMRKRPTNDAIEMRCLDVVQYFLGWSSYWHAWERGIGARLDISSVS